MFGERKASVCKFQGQLGPEYVLGRLPSSQQPTRVNRGMPSPYAIPQAAGVAPAAAAAPQKRPQSAAAIQLQQLVSSIAHSNPCASSRKKSAACECHFVYCLNAREILSIFFLIAACPRRPRCTAAAGCTAESQPGSGRSGAKDCCLLSRPAHKAGTGEAACGHPVDVR